MKAPCGWPDWLDHIWAKSPREPGARGETLAEHTWNTLCKIAELTKLRPGLPKTIGVPSLWQILSWAAFLHDWGKAAQAFQCSLRGGERWPHRHEVLSLVFLSRLETHLPQEELDWIASAIFFHHKDLDELRELYPAGLPSEYDPVNELPAQLDRETVAGLLRWRDELGNAWFLHAGLPVTVPQTLADPAQHQVEIEHILNGGHTLRKWVKRCTSFAKTLYEPQKQGLRLAGILLRGYMIQADHVASSHLGSFQPIRLERSHILQAVGITPSDLYDHQRRAGQSNGSTILIAPTGSGKTESALLWAATQSGEAQPFARLFYMLPFQASMNAMYDRLKRIFPDSVGLVHSRSTLAIYRLLMDQRYSPQEALELARLNRELSRLNLLPIRVLSPYQMLKAFFQLKGYEALLADLAEASFIVDEVHAYEPHRMAMILESFRYLAHQLGCRFFVMTATLPRPVLDRLADILNEPACIQATPELFRAFTRHQLKLLPGEMFDPEGFRAICDAVQTHRSTLVACNTVSRAQEMYLRLCETLGDTAEIMLLHGRFISRDRVQKERHLLSRMGDQHAGPRPIVLVATQVVEVSLNLDFDTLFSDPAPLEALIQRFGRVNRRRRMPVAQVHVFSRPDDGCGIYQPALVQATLSLLQDNLLIDESRVQEWLDLIYQSSVLESWCRQYDDTAREFKTAFIDKLYPFQSDEQLEQQFSRLFDGLEVLPECFAEEHERLKREKPLEASALLVPISWNQWQILVRQQRVRSDKRSWPPVVAVPYSSEFGLQLPGGAAYQTAEE